MQEKIQTLLAEYPVITAIPVQWGDMDAARHVNNTIYLKWFESGRLIYFETVDFTDFDHGCGPILAATDCKYLFPMTYPDVAYVGVKMKSLEQDRFTLQTAVVSQRHQRLAAIGHAVVVAYDYQNQQKTQIPEALRDHIFELEAGGGTGAR